MAECTENTAECGFCLRSVEAVEEPKVLSCTHVHCSGCLKGFYEVNHVLQCPLPSCRQVTEGGMSSLPSAEASAYGCVRCDSCLKNGDITNAAVYCTQCNRKYCSNHLKSHDDILSDHDRINMADYKRKAKRLEVRECANHKGQQYILGCKICLTLVCVECFSGLDSCTNAKGHNFLPCSDLVAVLVEKDIKARMGEKEESLEKLFKLASQLSHEYDEQTSHMVEMLNQKRNEQVKAINVKYDELEKKLEEKRKRKRQELADFMEYQVLQKWNELRNHRLKIDSKLEHSHQVDVIRGYQDIKGQVEGLVEGALPQLNLTDVVELAAMGDSRSIELEIVCSDQFNIDSKHGITRIPKLPTSKSPQRSLTLSAQPLSMCQYKGDVFVGLDNGTITRIDSNYQLHKSFITCNDAVESLRVHEDRVYALLYHEADDLVKVYNMGGQQVAGWRHAVHGSYNDAMCIVSGQLVIADRAANRLTVYSLDGAVLRHVPSPSFGSERVILCALDGTSIAISDRKKRKVFRLDLASGRVMWTYNTHTGPLAISCYGRSYVMVAFSKASALHVLDINTGERLTDFTDDNIDGDVYALTNVSKMLVAAKYLSKRVLFYK